MRKSLLLVGALALSGAALAAQGTPVKPELRPFAGAVIPTGNLRDLYSDAWMVGLSAALEVKPSFHVLATFSWVPAENKYGMPDNNGDVFQYTAGAELGFVKPLSDKWELRPFAGLGIGARTYTFQATGVKNETSVAGYGAVGTEFQVARTALRLEVRDNVFRYNSPISGESATTRNDIAFAFGVAYHFR